jgi:hypothetical protein
MISTKGTDSVAKARIFSTYSNWGLFHSAAYVFEIGCEDALE